MVEQTIVFVTQRSPRHQQDALEGAPPECRVVMFSQAAEEEIRAAVTQADFLISERAGRIDAELIESAPGLRLIQRLGSLTHDMDLEAARRAGVPVCATPVVGCVLVAEHMLMQMLALVKRLPDAMRVANSAAAWERPARRTDENTFAYNWSGRTEIGGILGKRIGIVGFGEIGVELARRLRPFQPAEVLYHKRSPLPQAVETDLGLRYVPQEDLVRRVDILCNLLPYAPETDLLLDGPLFAAMQPGSYLVSCGSGSVINEGDLAEALAQGHLAGAALDTFEWEPIRPENPLLPLARDPAANVLLTPHTAAGAGAGFGGRGRDYANIRRLLAGDPLQDRIA